MVIQLPTNIALDSSAYNFPIFFSNIFIAMQLNFLEN